MTTLNTLERQCLVGMLHREGIAVALCELAWLQVEAKLTKPVQSHRRAMTMTAVSAHAGK
jgi:hypothetical protein